MKNISITKKSLIVSISVALLLTLLVPLSNWYYWDSGLSNITPTVTRSHDFYPPAALLLFLFFWIPFVIYDLIGRRIVKIVKMSYVAGWFYVIYICAALLNAYTIFMAQRPEVDSGFAMLAVVFYTLPLLTIGTIGLLITWAMKRTAKKTT